MIVVKRMSGGQRGTKAFEQIDLFVDKVENSKGFLRERLFPDVYSQTSHEIKGGKCEETE